MQNSQILYNFGRLLEILFKSQIKRLSYGGDHVLRQTAAALQNKARSAVLLVLRHISDEVECLLSVCGWLKRKNEVALEKKLNPIRF